MKLIDRLRNIHLIRCITALLLMLVVAMVICDITIAYAAKDRLYDKVKDVPHRKVGLVLGTSPISSWTDRRNYYFDNRIKAAADLYNAGKVEWLIVSDGDYRKDNGYDEPVAMRDSLMKQGVDATHIVLDYDGTRTFNSIAKVRDVYGQDSIIIISQKYHNERALYQATRLGIDAIGLNAETPVGMRTPIWWRNRGREVLARVKVYWEIKTDKTFSYSDTINPFAKLMPFPNKLRNVLIWDVEWEECHGHESMELTDSLQKRICKFVELSPNYIVYRMDQLGCFNDSINYDLMTLMDDGYVFTRDDKESLANYLCKFTSIYNYIATHFRISRHNGQWPY